MTVAQYKVSASRQRGFTLFEIIVVVAIMGIIVSIALPYIPNDRESVLFDEIERFESRVAYAQTHAVLQSQDLGLVVLEGGYEFVQRVDADWRVIAEEPLQRQTPPNFLKHTLLVEGVEVTPGERVEGEVASPKVLLLSSGEVTPFTYQLSLSDKQYVSLAYDPLGEVKRDEANETQ